MPPYIASTGKEMAASEKARMPDREQSDRAKRGLGTTAQIAVA